MEAGPTFDTLLAQPGPSAPEPAPQSAAGGIVLNDASKQAALSAPIQQARVMTKTSLDKIATLAQKLAQEQRSPLSLDTQLSPVGEAGFQAWKGQNAPRDSGEDYDLRGAYKAGMKPSEENGHFPDTFKKPNHPTFSNESKFYKFAPEHAGRWEGERFIPPGQ